MRGLIQERLTRLGRSSKHLNQSSEGKWLCIFDCRAGKAARTVAYFRLLTDETIRSVYTYRFYYHLCSRAQKHNTIPEFRVGYF